MSTQSDVPTTDQALFDWSTNFSARITATPTAYGLVAADATALASLVADFTTRRSTATNPPTRTRITIAAKDTSKAALIAKCRSLGRIVKAFPSITPAQLHELGLHVRDREPTPIPPPATHPVVSVDKLGSLQTSLRISDELTPTRRAKPDGVTGANLFVKIDGEPPDSPDDCKYAGTATRNSHVISFPPGTAGKRFYVLARWVNPRNQPGPVSGVISGTIAA